MWVTCGYCAVFKGRRENGRGDSPAERSLKTQQYASARAHRIWCSRDIRHMANGRPLADELAEPDSVDVLGRMVGVLLLVSTRGRKRQASGRRSAVPYGSN